MNIEMLENIDIFYKIFDSFYKKGHKNSNRFGS
jgi:hypothetical protein